MLQRVTGLESDGYKYTCHFLLAGFSFSSDDFFILFYFILFLKNDENSIRT